MAPVRWKAPPAKLVELRVRRPAELIAPETAKGVAAAPVTQVPASGWSVPVTVLPETVSAPPREVRAVLPGAVNCQLPASSA